jgi:hypothetical protein
MPRGPLLIIAVAARIAPQFRAEDLPEDALPPRGDSPRRHGKDLHNFDPRRGIFQVPPGGVEVLDRHRGRTLVEEREEADMEIERKADYEMRMGQRFLDEARTSSAFVEGTAGKGMRVKQQQGFRALSLMMEQARQEGRLSKSLGIFDLLKDMAGAMLSTKEVIPGDYPYMCVCNPPMQQPDGTIVSPKDQDPMCPTDRFAFDCFVKREYRDKEAAWEEELPHPKMQPPPLGPPDGYLQTGERVPSFEHELRSSFAHKGERRQRGHEIYHLPEEQIQAIVADTKVQIRHLEEQLAVPVSVKMWRAVVITFMYFAKFFLLATGLLGTFVVMRMRKNHLSGLKGS